MIKIVQVLIMNAEFYENVKLARSAIANVCSSVPDEVCSEGKCPFKISDSDKFCMIAEMQRVFGKILNIE